MKNEKKATRESYGEELINLGEKNEKIIVLDADLSSATKTKKFSEKFSDRFFNIGIAEADMIGTAAGFATCGKIPFASTFAVFAAGRAYDQIRNSVCYPNLNVKICATHAGITVGEDGATHQMIEDIALMRAMPNMRVFSPSDDVQTRWLINEVADIDGPCYVRLSRLATPVIYDNHHNFELGKMIQFGDGTDATVFATGVTVSEALEAMEELKLHGINIRVVDVCSIKPIDEEMIIKCAKQTKRLISIEDHNVIGGLGSAIADVLVSKYPVKLEKMGILDCFGKSGRAQDLLKYFKIDKDSIINKLL